MHNDKSIVLHSRVIEKSGDPECFTLWHSDRYNNVKKNWKEWQLWKGGPSHWEEAWGWDLRWSGKIFLRVCHLTWILKEKLFLIREKLKKKIRKKRMTHFLKLTKLCSLRQLLISLTEIFLKTREYSLLRRILSCCHQHLFSFFYVPSHNLNARDLVSRLNQI